MSQRHMRRARRIPRLLVVAAVSAITCTGQTGRPGGERWATSRRALPRPRVTIRKGVLPIPDTRGVFWLSIARARASPLYRLYLKPTLSKLTGQGHAKSSPARALRRCGLVLGGNVDTLAFDLSSGPHKRGPGIFVFGGRFDAGLVLRCLEKRLRGAGKPFERFTLGPLVGLREPGGKSAVLLALGRHRLVYAKARSVASMRAVLLGKVPSISESNLYRAIRDPQGKSAVALMVIPSVRESLRSIPLAIANEILAVGLRLSLPTGGMDLEGLIPFGKPEVAERFVRTVPAFLGIAQSKVPIIGRIAKHLKLTVDGADPTVVRLQLRLLRRDFQALVAMLANKLRSGAKPRAPAVP